MTCDQIKLFLEQNADYAALQNLPEEFLEHCNHCFNCKMLLQDHSLIINSLQLLSKQEPTISLMNSLYRINSTNKTIFLKKILQERSALIFWFFSLLLAEFALWLFAGNTILLLFHGGSILGLVSYIVFNSLKENFIKSKL